MYNALFSTRTLFDDERSLREAFATELLFLESGASLALVGQITLGPNVSFSGNCSLGPGCRVEGGSMLTGVTLGQNCHVRAHSVLSAVMAGDQNLFGPFCFLRDGCDVGSECILGAHVEAARSRFGRGVRISHRAFIGDAEIRDGAIIGAGTVFCNFAQEERRHTVVEELVTIGSGTMIVAPLTIGKGAVIGAGSVITRDVGRDAKIIQKRQTSER